MWLDIQAGFDVQAGPIIMWVLWLAVALMALALVASSGWAFGTRLSKGEQRKAAWSVFAIAWWGYFVLMFGNQAAHWFSEAWPWGWGW
jgi:hypothetical protein